MTHTPDLLLNGAHIYGFLLVAVNASMKLMEAFVSVGPQTPSLVDLRLRFRSLDDELVEPSVLWANVVKQSLEIFIFHC